MNEHLQKALLALDKYPDEDVVESTRTALHHVIDFLSSTREQEEPELTYEEKRKLLKAEGNKYSSVAEMVRERGDVEFSKELEIEMNINAEEMAATIKERLGPIVTEAVSKVKPYIEMIERFKHRSTLLKKQCMNTSQDIMRISLESRHAELDDCIAILERLKEQELAPEPLEVSVCIGTIPLHECGNVSMALRYAILKLNEPGDANTKVLMKLLETIDPEGHRATLREMIFAANAPGKKIELNVEVKQKPPIEKVPAKPFGACYACEAVVRFKQDAYYDLGSRGPFCAKCYNDLPPEHKHEEDEHDEPLRYNSGGPNL